MAKKKPHVRVATVEVDGEDLTKLLCKAAGLEFTESCFVIFGHNTVRTDEMYNITLMDRPKAEAESATSNVVSQATQAAKRGAGVSD